MKKSKYKRRVENPEIGIEPILRKLGDNVRVLRELHGWNQTELAEKCGHDQVWVSYIERGARDTKITSLSVLAKALKTSVAALVG